jgi:hypothetical protein
VEIVPDLQLRKVEQVAPREFTIERHGTCEVSKNGFSSRIKEWFLAEGFLAFIQAACSSRLDNCFRQAEEWYRRFDDHWKRLFAFYPWLVPSRVREASDAVVRVVV